MHARAVALHPEELANAVSHGIGTALAGTALVVLVVAASLGGDPWRIVSLSVYGTTLTLLFAMSTAYHALRDERRKRLFRVLDHCAIFLLIAGTYTPFTLVTLRGPWGWSLFGVVWGLALAGVLAKTVSLRWERLSTALYLLMGWLGIVAVVPIVHTLPVGGIAWLVAGGLAYSLGVAFFAWRTLPYHHLVWHVFVLLGAACHFTAIAGYVLPTG